MSQTSMDSSKPSVAVVGGCGHVGLALGLTFAKAGCQVFLQDVNPLAVRSVSEGQMPFMEEGGAELLRAHVGRNLTASTDPSVLARADAVICAVGTPIDEHLNPQLDKLLAVVEELRAHLSPRQLFVLRSTVYPGATARIHEYLQARVPGIDVAFCPERVTQGFAVREISTTPQIVAGVTERAHRRACELFRLICPKTVDLRPMEAELAKLFCNAWRYVSFALANQFYTVCAKNGLDYYDIWQAVTQDYPRMGALPKAGLTAGPCLFKDTMQLVAFYNNEFSLGQAAMLVNEGFPRALVDQLRLHDLSDKVVGILGMAFKGDSDDVRDSLSFKLRKLLKLECREVLCTDERARTPGLVPLGEVLERADLLVIAAPHSEYRSIQPRQPVLDPWNLLGRGGLLQTDSAKAR